VEPGAVHHLEVWVDDLDRAERSFGWLLPRLGWRPDGRSATSMSFQGPGYYVFFEAGPDRVPGHDRMRSGLNHLALVAGSRADVDAIAAEAAAHGWSLMFRDRHPFAGGADHYAAYVENEDGFEVELVAAP
jgi:catechol 2,3-dioxygenase-like lactoylglutathione lyase family enzyme